MTHAALNLGQQGEAAAHRHLVRLGARVLARNYRSRFGEIDLVVHHEGDLVGVEVKTRAPGQPALPEEAVNAGKLARLERLLADYARQHGFEDDGWRIDVVAIEMEQSGVIRRLEHIRDAYG